MLCCALHLSAVAQRVQVKTYDCELTKHERDTIEMIARFEADFYSRISIIDKDIRLRINLYGNKDEFKAQRKNKLETETPNGFYSQTRKQVYVYKYPNFMRTCFHESSHFLLHDEFEYVPVWLNEGLAEYFECAKFDTNGIRILSQPKRALRVKQELANGISNLKVVLILTSKEFREPGRKNKNYSIAWGLIYFLMNKDEKIVLKMIPLLASHKNPIDVIEDCYPGGFEALYLDLVKYYE